MQAPGLATQIAPPPANRQHSQGRHTRAADRTSAPVSTAVESSSSSSGDFGPFIFLNVSLALRRQGRISRQGKIEHCSSMPARQLPKHDLALLMVLLNASNLHTCCDDWTHVS